MTDQSYISIVLINYLDTNRARFDFKIPVKSPTGVKEISGDAVIAEAGIYYYTGGDSGIQLNITPKTRFEEVEIFACSGDATIFLGNIANIFIVTSTSGIAIDDAEQFYGGRFHATIILDNGKPKSCFILGEASIG